MVSRFMLTGPTTETAEVDGSNNSSSFIRLDFMIKLQNMTPYKEILMLCSPAAGRPALLLKTKFFA